MVELAPGGGYYTRLLSAAVGPKGKVIAVMSPPKPDAKPDAPVPGAAVRAIAADPHYANITVSLQRITASRSGAGGRAVDDAELP